jgi:hypothetical protein
MVHELYVKMRLGDFNRNLEKSDGHAAGRTGLKIFYGKNNNEIRPQSAAKSPPSQPAS